MNEEQIKKLINEVITERLRNNFGIEAFSDNIVFSKKKLKFNNEQIGFFKTSEAGQQTAIVDAAVAGTISGANTVNASNINDALVDHRSRINLIIDRLESFGLIINSD